MFNLISYFLKANWAPLLLALSAASMTLGFMPVLMPLYYAVLAATAIWAVTRGGKPNLLLMGFYVAASLSILISQPPAVFRSWPRLGFFVMLTAAVFPLFMNPTMDRFRYRVFLITMWVCVFVGVTGPLCYAAGINFYINDPSLTTAYEMSGLFGGLTRHSMVLGPMSSTGALFLLYRFYKSPADGSRRRLWLLAGIALSVLSVVLSASRSALLALAAAMLLFVFLAQDRRMGRTLKWIVGLTALLLVTFPLYQPYTVMLQAKQEKNVAEGGTFNSRDFIWDMRTAEFEEHPLFGYGYAAIDWSKLPAHRQDYINSEGTVEPGSTWLAVFSMTGLCGGIPFCLLVLLVLARIWNYERESTHPFPALLVALLVMSVIHQFAEGYALSAGSYFAFYFWLLLGVCSFYPLEEEEVSGSLLER